MLDERLVESMDRMGARYVAAYDARSGSVSAVDLARSDAMDGVAAQLLTQELVRGLNRLTLACEGQDHELDIELRELRAFLRMKTLSREVLSSKLDVLEERLRRSGRREKKTDGRLDSAIATLIDQVEASKPPRVTQRAAQVLRKEMASLEPLDALARAVALRAEVRITRHSSSGAASGGGLLERLFGARRTEPGQEKVVSAPPVEQPVLPLPEPEDGSPRSDADAVAVALDESAQKILVELVELLEPPESSTRQHGAYPDVRKKVDRRILATEVSDVLEEILLLVRGSLEQSRQEFSLFLEQLSSRLVAAAETIADGGNLDNERRSNSNTLDSAMRAGLEEIRDQISGTRDIQALKQEVNKRLDGVGQAFESFREQEERIGQESAAGARALAERVIELQQKTRDAEAMIEEQRRLANTDTLTRLPNREAWAIRMQQEFERWQRYRRPLALAICDIDRFKTVNDRFGHAVGDAVLRAVAACVSSQIRKTDFVARFGGEEFVFLLPETTPEQAKGAMEKVREALASLIIDGGDRRVIKVTASFGVAGFADEDEPDRVFSRADGALYTAKSAGRDRVMCYSVTPA